eukprot:COSAG02_NODE_6504_length_3534_cov_1.715575_3_plen_463_part_00
MGEGGTDLAAVADEEFAQGLKRAARAEGEPAKREGFVRVHSLWQATVGGDGIGDVDLREMAASRLLAYRLTWADTDEPDAPTPEPVDDVDSPPSRCSAAVDLTAMSPIGQQKQRQTVGSEPWPSLWGRLVALGWHQETRVREGGREDHYYIPPHRREGSPRRLDSRVKVRRYVADGAIYASGTPKPATTGRPTDAPQMLALPLPRQLPAGPKKPRQRQLSQQQVRSSGAPPTPLTASTTASHISAASLHTCDPGMTQTSPRASDHGVDGDSDLGNGAAYVKRRRLTSQQAEEQEARPLVRSLAEFKQPKCYGSGRSHYNLTGNDDGPTGADSLIDASHLHTSAAATQAKTNFDMPGTTVRHETNTRASRPPLATKGKSTATGASDRMIVHPQLQCTRPHAHGPAPSVPLAPASKLVPGPIKPSRRSRKPPPRWCEDPLATAELGGSAAKLQELELQRRQNLE